MFETAQDWLISHGLTSSWATLVLRLALGIAVVIVAWIAWFVARQIVRKVIAKIVSKSTTKWDDIMFKHGVVDHALQIVPAVVLQLLVAVPLNGLPVAIDLVRTALQIYMLVVAMLTIDSLLNAGLEIYRLYPASRRLNLKPTLQVVKVIVYIIFGMSILSILLNRSPVSFLAGMGAMSALTMLIFKDAILGFVAGIQLTANNMVQRGDWIQMPKYGADGDVLEIALTTVKVQNWDKTITTIPTYALISDSFKNWRGMEESGGRRIKRSLPIDMTTVRICDQAMIQRFSKFAYISDYIQQKQKELADWNDEHGVGDDELINGRRLTNLGTFRAYVVAYLRQHSQINQDMTLLVRQLQPTDEGLPMEIYVFSNDQRWVQYEDIQSDIFDHIIAVVPEFELGVFQRPTGQDVLSLTSAAGGSS